MSEPIYSRPYRPQMCCEACVYGHGLHAEWCHKKWIYCGDNTFLNRNLFITAFQKGKQSKEQHGTT